MAAEERELGIHESWSQSEWRTDAKAPQHRMKSLVLALMTSVSEENSALEVRRDKRRDLMETLEAWGGGE